MQLSQRILQTWYYISIFNHCLSAWTTPEIIYFQYIFLYVFLLPHFNNTENHIRTLICWLLHLIFLNRLNSFSWQYFYLQVYHFSFFSPFFPVFQVTLGGILTVKGVYLVLKSLHWGIFMTSLTWILSVPVLLGDSSVIWRPQTIWNQNILIKRVFSGKG